MIDVFLLGAGVGLAVAAPVGPIGLLCIRRTLARGWASGVRSGLGAAAADATYGMMVAAGLSATGVLVRHAREMQFVGGLLIALLGALAIRAFLDTAPARAAQAGGWGSGALGEFASTYVLTISNPMTIVAFAGLVAGLVLIATGARLRVASTILEGIRNDFDGTTELITRSAWSSEAPSRLTQLGQRALQETGPDVLLADFTACDRFDVMERLREVKTPTLVIGGSIDQLTPVKYARFAAEHICDTRLVVVEGAGHMAMLERPAEVTRAVQDFLKKPPP